MATVIFGIVVLALALWALNAFTKVSPQTAAVVLKTGGGLGALAIAGVLGVRGRLDIAIPLGLTGLGLLGWLPWSIPSLGDRLRKSTGQVSRVRSAFVEMELDHDTGAMRGRILVGRHEGAMLDALDVATLVGLLAEIDEESRALLMAYLDRRAPSWREHAQGDAAAGPGRGVEQRQNDGGGGLSDPWREAGGERRGHRSRPPCVDEEIASRPRGVDVSCGSRQRSQGRPFAPPSLNSFTRHNTWRLLFNAVSRFSFCRCQFLVISTSVLDHDAVDAVALEVLAGSLRLVLVKSGEAGAVVGRTTLIHGFGKRIRTNQHFRRLALHG